MVNEIILKTNGETFKPYPKLYLKLNSLFKEMGFKEVHFQKEIDSISYCKELTLYVNPQGGDWHDERRYLSEAFRNKVRHLKGYNSGMTLYRSHHEGNIYPIMIEEEHLGDYHADKNYVVFDYPIEYLGLENQLDNEFLFFFVEGLKKEIERIKPVIVDVSDKIKGAVYDKFIEGMKKTSKDLRKKVINNQTKITSSQESELKWMSENKNYNDQIKVLEGTYSTIKEDLAKTIEDIKKLSFVKRVGLSQKGLRIDFIHIDLEYEGRKVELGECYCYLNPSKMEIKNKSPILHKGYSHTPYHHPHIHGGDVCFGTGKTKAFELLSSMKFKELAYFIYLYLKTYNSNDTYLSVHNWELLKEEEKKAKEKEKKAPSSSESSMTSTVTMTSSTGSGGLSFATLPPVWRDDHEGDDYINNDGNEDGEYYE